MEDVPPVLEPKPEPVPPPPGTSLLARLLNVFAMPGEVFAEVRASRFHVGNWLVPALLLALVGALYAVVFVSQPAFRQSWHDQQGKVLAQQVKAGLLHQAEADKALAFYTNPTVLQVGGAGLGAAVSVARVFWWGLALWVLGRRFLQVPVGFLKALEVSGLALMIAVLGGVVSLLLMVNVGKLLSGPSLALSASAWEASPQGDLFLVAACLFFVWQIAVTGVGLSRLANVPFQRAVVLVFIFWCLQEMFLALLGAGALLLA